MSELYLTVKASAPLHIAAGREDGNYRETLGYIPGSVLRGALAAEYVQGGGSPVQKEFQRLFVSDEVRYGDLLPIEQHDRPTYVAGLGRSLCRLEDLLPIEQHDRPTRPLPLSAYTCKRKPGFRYRARKHQPQKHGVVDLLSRMTVATVAQDIHPLESRDECSHCHHELKQHSGFYYQVFSNQYAGLIPRRRVLTHVGINRATQTAEEGILFARQVLEEGRLFSGPLRVDDTALEGTLKQQLVEGKHLWVGAGRSRGYGAVEVLSLASLGAEPLLPLAERVERFNAALADVARDAKLPWSGCYVSVTLLSDSILCDEFWRYQSRVTPQTLGLSDAQLVRWISEMRPVIGWNAALNLPKEDSWAIRAGSVFVYQLGEEEEAMTRLAKLEIEGIGERRSEGFGRLIVCDPFHWEVDEQ